MKDYTDICIMNKLNKHIILFDGVCNLCNSAVQFVITIDKGELFKFASLQSEKGKELLQRFMIDQSGTDSFVYIEGENYYTQSTAALKVLKNVGGLWKLFYVFMIIPKPARDFFYKLVAKNRYKLFGKREACMVPDSSLLNRFIG